MRIGTELKPPKISRKKTPAQKASFLRKYIDLPFRNTVNFTAPQKRKINQLYDGTKKSPGLRRYSGATRVKIDNNQATLYAEAGHTVVRKSYRYRGKRRVGTYILTRLVHPDATIRAMGAITVEKIGTRTTYRFPFDNDSRLAFLAHPEAYIAGLLSAHAKRFSKHRQPPTLQLLFPGGPAHEETESVDLLVRYLESLPNDVRKRISGIA